MARRLYQGKAGEDFESGDDLVRTFDDCTNGYELPLGLRVEYSDEREPIGCPFPDSVSVRQIILDQS